MVCFGVYYTEVESLYHDFIAESSFMIEINSIQIKIETER